MLLLLSLHTRYNKQYASRTGPGQHRTDAAAGASTCCCNYRLSIGSACHRAFV
jgi:hypothetical protein